MSEIKRVALNTLEPQKVSDKATKTQCKTVRISVILPESNEDNCPEYNYKDQLAAVKRKSKQIKDSNHVENAENGLDQFGETDDDVRRIALEMEAKYGTGVTDGKKKRKSRKDDYADIGMGYDESDSFIDNTDGYDEIIPQNVTTLHGGFYINCGALEFKTDDEASSQVSSSSSSSSDDEDANQTKKNRKRVLESSAESDSETEKQNEKKPKLQSEKNTMQQAIKKKLFSANKIQVKKRRPIDPLKKTVKDLLREKRVDLNMSVPAELKEIEENMEKDSLKENKVPMSITSVTDAIESVLKQVVEEDDYLKNHEKSIASVDTKSPPSVSKNAVESSQPQPMETESSQELNKSEKHEVVKLPENLPSDIMEIVEKIRDAAVNYKGEGKKAFFTDEVNSFLLSLERKCKVLGKSSRLRVYEHLSGFVICRKETLIKRAKNLVLEDEERRLKMLTIKLKDTIDCMMPSLLIIYEQESQKVLQKKFSKESANSEDTKSLKMPRRKFQWTEDAKRLIKDILSIKKRCLLLEGKQKDKLEEQVVDYLKAVILPLWPEGWMYLNNLKKVYNSMSDISRIVDNNTSAASNSNKTKHSIHNNSSTTSPKVANSLLGKLGADVQLFDSKFLLANAQSAASVSSEVVKENDKYKSEPVNNPSYPPKSESSKRLDDNSVFKHYAEKYVISSPQYPKTVSSDMDKPADLSKGSKCIDMSKPKEDIPKQSGQSNVFKPYMEKNLLQDHSFPFVDRKSPKVEETLSKSVCSNERYVSHADVAAKADKVSTFVENYTPRPENLSAHVEKYATREDKYAGEKLSSHPEAHAQSSETASLYAENRIVRKENSVFYSDKSLLSTDPRPAHEDKKLPSHVENPQAVEKKHYPENQRQSVEILYPETSRLPEKPRPDKARSSEKARYEDKARHAEKSHHSEKHRHSEKQQLVDKPRHSDKYQSVESMLSHSDKYVSRVDKHSTRDRMPPYSENFASSHADLYGDKPSDLSKHYRLSDAFMPVADKPNKEFSKYEVFKPYAETPSRSHSGDFGKHHRSKEHYRANDVAKTQAERSIMSESSPRHVSHHNDFSPSSRHHSRGSDGSSVPKQRPSDESGVIVKNTHQPKEDPRKDHCAVMSKVSHGQGNVSTDKRKKLPDPRTPDLFDDVRSAADFLPKPVDKLLDYHSSTPAKTEGDDIQMVMENLKALQKLSCSPIKNDNSSSSPVSVIAYNKNFSSSSKSNSEQKVDASNKGDASAAFQDDFQKQFINSLQQMAASPSTTKSSYNRCS